MDLRKELSGFLTIFIFIIFIGAIIYFVLQFREFYSYKNYINNSQKNISKNFKKLNMIGCKDDPISKTFNLPNKKINKFCPEVIEENINSNFFSFLLKEDEKLKLSNITKEKKNIISSNQKTNKPLGCVEGDCINNFSKKKYSNGDYYIGEFKNQNQDGHGTYVWNSGDKYIGEWKDGNRTGQGTYNWKNGSKYSGEWLNGNRHGLGTYINSSGAKYIGEYEGNEKHGQGSFYLPNGDKFEGEWKFDERNGEGIFIWANSGDKYIGSFLDGKKAGRGTYIWKDNTIYVGSWRDNEMIHGIQTNPDGKKLLVWKTDGETKVRLLENNNQAQKVDLIIKQLKRKNDLQTNRMLLDISKSLMGTNQNTTSQNNPSLNLNYGGGWLSGSSSSGMYKTCSYTSSLGTKTKTVFASAPCSMAY